MCYRKYPCKYLSGKHRVRINSPRDLLWIQARYFLVRFSTVVSFMYQHCHPLSPCHPHRSAVCTGSITCPGVGRGCGLSLCLRSWLKIQAVSRAKWSLQSEKISQLFFRRHFLFSLAKRGSLKYTHTHTHIYAYVGSYMWRFARTHTHVRTCMRLYLWEVNFSIRGYWNESYGSECVCGGMYVCVRSSFRRINE